mmetsp:Transcript_684/g.1656  ORF Transcript_684/g.1656 Transcript_684/m.1656 type:complete len:169 (-) Transcript_684:126-632(-)
MGRRAKKAPVQTKKRPTLAKRFKCPFCSNENAVECKMDFKAGTGALACRLCGASYQMPIHHLHEPVDVFSEWLDDCEAAAQGKTSSGDVGGGGMPSSSLLPLSSSRHGGDDDDDIPASSGLGNNNNKRNRDDDVDESPTASKKTKGGGNTTKSYASLGLNDSDDSDDE